MTSQKQKSGANSTNLQVNELTVNNGVSYSEAKDIAQTVFNQNFMQFEVEAKDIAQKRAAEITDKFLEKLQEENPEGLLLAKTPDFQSSLYTVQKEYALVGDEKLGDLLVNILVSRSKESDRNLMQICLSEALTVIPKLTQEQINSLTICFLIKKTRHTNITSQEKLGEWLDHCIKPIVNDFAIKYANYQHLIFTGCCSDALMNTKIETTLQQNYQGLFLKGFKSSELEKFNIDGFDNFLRECVNDKNNIQLNFLNEESLKKYLSDKNIDSKEEAQFINLFNKSKMSDQEVRGKCIDIRPYLKDFFNSWDSSMVSRMELTTIGMAIAHANLKKVTDDNINLSIWIEE